VFRRFPMKTMNLSSAHTSRALVGPLGRWAVGPLGRWAVGPLLSVCAMCLGSQAAHADWTFLRAENSGTCSSAGHSTSWNVSKNPKIDILAAEMGATAQPSTISSQGTITLVFGWSPTPGKTRPKTLTVLASTLAKLVSYGDGTPVILSGITVDDGHGSPQQLVVEGNDVYSTRTYSSSGKWLLTVDADGGKTNAANGLWEVQVPLAGLHTEASAQTATTRVHASFVQALVVGSATVDTRAVTLSRGGKDKVSIDKSGNSSAEGDTTYSYLQGNPLAGTTLAESISTIKAQLSGNTWTLTQQKSILGNSYGPSFPDVDYSWDISGPTDSQSDSTGGLSPQGSSFLTKSGQSSYPNGQDTAREQKAVLVSQHQATLNVSLNPPRWESVPSPSPQDITFTYTVTDRGDKATATAKYVLHVHDEIEWAGSATTVPAPRRYSYVLDHNGQLVNIVGTDLVELGTYKEFSTSTDQGFDIGVSGGVPIGRLFEFLKPFLDAKKAPVVVDPATKTERAPDSPLEFSASYNRSWGNDINNGYPLPYEISRIEKAYAVSIRTYQWQLRPFRYFQADGEVTPGACGGGPGSGITDDGKFWRTDYQERTGDAPDVKWLKVRFDFYPNPTDPVDWNAAEKSFFGS